MTETDYTEQLLELYVYKDPVFSTLKPKISVLSADEKKKVLYGELKEIPNLNDMEKRLCNILLANLSGYKNFTALYQAQPEQFYVLEEAWKVKADLGVFAQLSDNEKRLEEELTKKNITFKIEEHKQYFKTVLNLLKNDESDPNKSYLDKIRAWAKDDVTKKLAAFATISILVGNAVLRGVEYSDFADGAAAGYSALAFGVKSIFSPTELVSLANTEAELSAESLQFLFEGNPIPQGRIQNYIADLKVWSKDAWKFIKDLPANLKKPEVWKTFGRGFGKAIIIANFAYVAMNFVQNWNTYKFINRAREGLSEKTAELDQIEKDLKDIRAEVKNPLTLGDKSQENLADVLKKLDVISEKLQNIAKWIEENIKQAEEQKKANEIAGVVGTLLAVGSAVSGGLIGGAFKALGAVGAVVGVSMVVWNVVNFFQLKDLLKDLKEQQERVNSLAKETQDIIKDIMKTFEDLDKGLIKTL